MAVCIVAVIVCGRTMSEKRKRMRLWTTSFTKCNHLNTPLLCRMLFFTDYGNVAKVERCNMDGTNRTRLVDYKIEQPTAVALDVVKKLVYWADAYLDYIDVVDYNGRNRHTIIHGSQVSVIFHCKHYFFLSSSGSTS